MCQKCDEKQFVHLHCHSEYSLLDRLSRTAEMGQPAIALTDHGRENRQCDMKSCSIFRPGSVLL